VPQLHSLTRRGQVHSKRNDILGVDALTLVSAYVIQIVLIWITNSNGLTIPLALHPSNGSLILVIALALLMKLRTSSTVPARAR
jgi:hypothetical protein